MAGQLKTETLVVLGVALAVLGMAYYAKQKVGGAIGAVGQAASEAWDAAKDATKYVNPTSDKNVAYQGSSALTRWLTGQEDGSLGTIVWDYVHKAEPGAAGTPTNYTPAQQAADEAAMRQLEAGFHGM